MRKVTGAVFQSLDGIMQAPGGPQEDPSGGPGLGGWMFHFADESTGERMGKLLEAEYDILLGKRTYDIFAAYWPYNQDHPIGAKFQRINKYVLTHSHEPLKWDHSHRIYGDTAQAIGELKHSEGRDLLIQGSSTIYPPLLSAELIDCLILMTFPVLLGQGKSIFDGTQKSGSMRMADHFVSDSGVTFATYEPAGEVPIGSFETKQSSEAELARRSKNAEDA